MWVSVNGRSNSCAYACNAESLITSPLFARQSLRIRMFCCLDTLEPCPFLAKRTLLLGLDTGCLFCLGLLLSAAAPRLGMTVKSGIKLRLKSAHKESTRSCITTGVRGECTSPPMHGLQGLHGSPLVAAVQVASSGSAERLTRKVPSMCTCACACAGPPPTGKSA